MKDVETGNLAEVQARLVGRKKIDVDTKDPLGDTALIIASKKGHINVVQALLDAGANIDQQDQRGYTALMISLYRFIRVPTEYSNIVTLLLDYNANIHIETMPRTVSISKVSPFSFALDGQEQLMKHYTAEKILRILQSNERQDIQSEIPILDVKKMRIYYRILTKYRQDRNAGYRYNST
jgi:ankyrin repeat protein